MAKVGGSGLYSDYKMNKGVKYVNQDNLAQLYLNNTWRPTLSIVGAAGIPNIEKAGNVVRQSTTVKLSVRLPPNAVPEKSFKALKDLITKDVPYNCKIELGEPSMGSGWCMNEPTEHMSQAMNQASEDFFNGKGAKSYGIGGSIPFLAELGKIYPKAAIMALGLNGPESNIHAPNEALNIEFAKNLTCSLSHIIVAFGAEK